MCFYKEGMSNKYWTIIINTNQNMTSSIPVFKQTNHKYYHEGIFIQGSVMATKINNFYFNSFFIFTGINRKQLFFVKPSQLIGNNHGWEIYTFFLFKYILSKFTSILVRQLHMIQHTTTRKDLQINYPLIALHNLQIQGGYT